MASAADTAAMPAIEPRRNRVPLIAGGALAAAAAVGVVLAIVLASGHTADSKTTTVVPATAPLAHQGGETGDTPGSAGATDTIGSATASTGNTGGSANNTGNTGSTTGTTGGGGGGGPLAAVKSYWSSISNRDYSSAYSYLASRAVNLTDAQFVAQEQQAGIQSVSFNGHVTGQNGETATVAVDSLMTKDEQFGCRTWSGSYDLVEQSGQWLIARASIAPRACGG